MTIWLIIIAIAIISVILSLISLRDLENKSHLNSVKKKLLRGRVIFQDSSSKK